jgi:hypothetical protein
LKDSGLGDQDEVIDDHRQAAPGLEMLTTLREVYEESRALRIGVERSTSRLA